MIVYARIRLSDGSTKAAFVDTFGPQRTLCSSVGCRNKKYAKKLCHKHFNQQRGKRAFCAPRIQREACAS